MTNIMDFLNEISRVSAVQFFIFGTFDSDTYWILNSYTYMLNIKV